MEDGQNSNQQTRTNADIGPSAPAGVEDTRNRQPAGQDSYQQEGAPDHTIRLRDAPTFDRVTRIIALIGLAATIGTLGVNYAELQAIQGQLTAATDANKQYVRQANAAEGSLALARSASLSADRPFVLPNVAPFTLPQTPSNSVINISMFNTGRSPALAVKESFAFGLTDKAEPEFDQGRCNSCNSFVLAPGVSLAANGISDTIDITPQNLTQADIDALKDGTKRMFAIGRVDYKDTNNQPHKTLSCVIFTPKVNNFTACKRDDANYAD